VIKLVNCEPEDIQNEGATCPSQYYKYDVKFKLCRIPCKIVLAFLLNFLDKHVSRDLFSDCIIHNKTIVNYGPHVFEARIHLIE